MRFRLTGILILLLLSAHGQDIQFGDAVDQKRKAQPQTFLTEIGDSLILYKTRKKFFTNDREMVLEIFNKSSLEHLTSITVEPPEFDAIQTTMVDIKQIQGKIIMLSTYFDEQTQHSHFILSQLNKNSQQFENGFRLIEIRKPSAQTSVNRKIIRTDQGLIFLFKHPIPNGNLNKVSIITIAQAPVFERNSITATTRPILKEIEVPVNKVILDFLSIDDKYFLLTEVQSVKDEQEILTPKKNYALFAYDMQSDQKKSIDIRFKDKYPMAVNLAKNLAGNPILSGFYTDEGRKAIDGAFYVELEASNFNVVQQSLSPINQEKVSAKPKLKGSNQQTEFAQFKFDDLHFFEDGSTVLIAEKYYQYVQTYFDPRTNVISRVINYYYNEIIVMKINTEGSIEWTFVLPKKQYSQDDKGRYLSYGLLKTKNALNIFYNDVPENDKVFETSTPKIQYLTRPDRSELILVKILQTGEIKGKRLFKNEQRGFVTRPAFSFTGANNNLYMLSDTRKQIRLVAVSF